MSSSYINQFNNLTNGLLINKLRNELDKNYSLSIQNNINQSIYESKLSSLKNFFGDIIYIVSVMIGIFLVWNNINNISVGKLLFIINTTAILNSNISGISSYFSQKVIYMKLKNIYLMFYEIDNIKNTNKLDLNEIKSLQINKKHISNKTFIKNSYLKSYFDFITDRKYQKNLTVKINGIESNKISQNWLNNNIYYFLPQLNFAIEPISYDDMKNNKLIFEIMNKFKLDLNNDPKSKDKTLINLISLLKQNNKLIIFDKYFNEFNLNEKKYIKDVDNQ